MSVYVRWLIRKDLPNVMEIENESFRSPLDREDLMQVLKGRTVIGMVAADEEENVVGFMIYELRTRGIYLIDVAVAKAHRRRGVGRAMMDKLIAKLDARRPRLCVSVDEYSLDAQLFFRSMGFRFKKILHGFYGESDAYLMEVDSERQANQAV